MKILIPEAIFISYTCFSYVEMFLFILWKWDFSMMIYGYKTFYYKISSTVFLLKINLLVIASTIMKKRVS